MESAIGDHAVIGDCRSAALISRAGAIDWLCWPRFDSNSWLAALLDPARGGHFGVAPAGALSTARRYVGDTNVLETTFRTATGVVRLTDLMPVDSEAAKRRTLWPQHEILRRVECVEGEATVEVNFAPRPDYGRAEPRLRDRRRLGIACEHGDQMVTLRSEIPLRLEASRAGARGAETLHAGERRFLSLTFADGEPAVLPPLGARAEERLRASLAWWEGWAARCRYQGPYRAAVVRSALALKLMSFAPSGAVVAAPTTSLPERLGGARNWDYRYCWLRDASLTLQALLDIGYDAEAESFLSWLIYTTHITWPELRVLYDVYGRTNLGERVIDTLAGYDHSRPVRVGNAAAGQRQLDIYGEVLDAVYQFIQRGGRLDRVTGRMLVRLGETVCNGWREPDEGIWEIRAGPRQHTYSKAMCWVALDRLLRLHEAGQLRVPVASFTRAREEIRRQIETHGFNEQLGSYVSVLDGDAVDASLLRLARQGCIEPTSPRMRGTLDLIRRRLGADGVLLYRYRDTDDGLPPGEGAFGICTLWEVRAQALAGDPDGAAAALEKILNYANDVGLFAEEIDPATGAALGNFPQAFTHVGVIDAALTLAASGTGQGARRGAGSSRGSAA